MKRFMYLFIVLFILRIDGYAQSTDVEVIRTLNNYREDLKIRALKHDTLMQKGETKIFQSPRYSAILSSDDSIRKYLRKAGCHDYNIKMITVKTNDFKKTGVRNYKDKTLATAISDSGYNTVASISNPGTNTTYILLTKNYITIKWLECNFPGTNFTTNEVIPEELWLTLEGTTSLEGFYYQVVTDSLTGKPEFIDTRGGKFKIKTKQNIKSVIFRGTDNQILAIYENY